MAIKKEELANPNSCLNRAHDDEPVFVLLGRDKSAPVAMRAWIYNRLATGKSSEASPEIVEARAFVEIMDRYAQARGKERR